MATIDSFSKGWKRDSAHQPQPMAEIGMRHPYRGYKKAQNLKKRLGDISGHVPEVDVSRGAING